MCTKSCKKKVKLRDNFGAPIGVTFKGEPDYKTVLGGSVTIFLFIILGSSLTLNLVNYLISHNFTRKSDSLYLPVTEQRDTWSMPTHN